MKKIIFFASISLSSAAFAKDIGKSVLLSCEPTAPCEYVGKGLKFCVSKIVLSGRAGHKGTAEIFYRHQNIGYEIMIAPKKHDVLIGAAQSPSRISFQDQTGDQHGQLKFAPGAKYAGKITVDQDFEFAVTCRDEAIGFE